MAEEEYENEREKPLVEVKILTGDANGSGSGSGGGGGGVSPTPSRQSDASEGSESIEAWKKEIIDGLEVELSESRTKHLELQLGKAEKALEQERRISSG